MIKIYLILSLLMTSLCLNAQHNYDNQSVIYSSNGNIGIGITSPAGQLSFKNQIGEGSLKTYSAISGINGQSVFNSYYVLDGNDVGPYPRIFDIASVGSPDGINGGGVIRFLTNPISANSPAVERMRITSNGNVGIGITSPVGQLSMKNQIGEGSLKTYSAISGINGQSIFNSYYVLDGNDVGPYPRIFDIASVGSPDGINGGGVIRFLTNPISANSPAVERMRIISNGNVGIGNISPNSTLSVQGRVGIRADGIPTTPGEALRVEGAINADENVVNITNLSDQDFLVRLSEVGSTNKRTIIGPSVPTRFSLGVGITNDNEYLTIINNGDVGIGTISPDAKLTVKGDIHTQEVTVDLHGAVAPDFVFEEDYDLKSLEETEEYIQANKHLPEIPSAREMEENGFELKEMNLKLLQKVEELTLYLIEQNKELKDQKDRIAELERTLESEK